MKNFKRFVFTKIIFAVLVISCLSLLVYNNYHQSSVSILYPFIELEIAAAKAQLQQNPDKKNAEKLIADLDNMWTNINQSGYTESTGIDNDLRPSYVVMQGIVELAQSKALAANKIKHAEGFIIAPKMPTPLMLSSSMSLAELDIDDLRSFAYFRNGTLKEYFKNNGVIHAVYSHDARAALAMNQAIELANYEKYQSPQLKDQPIISVDMTNFPPQIAGALYNVDGNWIAIESRQLNQMDDSKTQIWSIKFGNHSQERKNAVKKFLDENGAKDLL